MPVDRPPTPAEAISPGGLLDLPNAFTGSSWDRWRAVLKAAWGEALTAEEGALFREVAERDPPAAQVKELWCKVGRSGGKDAIASAIATVSALRSYATRRPGERTLIACIAVDRTQAEIVFGYIVSYFQHVPALNALVAPPSTFARRVVDKELSAELGTKMYVVTTSDNTLDLTNGARIVVSTNNFRTVRGRSLICCILDEVAFYRDEQSTNPDKELYDALEPALARVPGSILIGISSPYRRSGLLYEKWRRSFGKDDADCLFVQGPTKLFNPGFPQSVIDRRYEEDPAAASAEYGAEFRSDIDAYVTREVVDAVTMLGRRELLPLSSERYVAFVDPSGGSGDSMTLAIAHKGAPHDSIGTQPKTVGVLDAVREVRPPFSPEATVAGFVELLKTYRITKVTGDRYGGEFCREPFRKLGIQYELSEKSKSDIYQNCLPLLNSGKVELLDHAKLTTQFIGLERRTARGGRDSIDHAPGAHDDLVNSACGALLLARGGGGPMRISTEALERLGIRVPGHSYDTGGPVWRVR